MSLFSRLFGGGAAKSEPDHPPVSHEGYTIRPEPVRDGTSWRVGATIEKVIDGETKRHVLVRADRLEDAKTASEVSVAKAKQMIAEQGDRLFG